MSRTPHIFATTLGHRPSWSVPAVVYRRIADASATLLVATALLLVARRSAGALRDPLGPGAAAVVAALLGLLVVSALWTDAGMRRLIIVMVSLFALATALTTPGMGISAALLIWAPGATVVGLEVWRRRLSPSRNVSVRSQVTPLQDSTSPQVADDSLSVTRRYLDAAGRDCFEGTFRCVIPAGGRIGVVHAAFHPPFEATPTIAVEFVGASEAVAVPEFRTTLLLPYGARVEVRRPSPAGESCVLRVRLQVQGPAVGANSARSSSAEIV
ncbi:MAG: hypothetical protein QM775_24730 [Pirellulales bacterium]